jgi:hypothetical protein
LNKGGPAKWYYEKEESKRMSPTLKRWSFLMVLAAALLAFVLTSFGCRTAPKKTPNADQWDAAGRHG